MANANVIICNKLGLHARASAKFVQHAAKYNCQIEVIKGNKRVNGKSIMGIMMLAANKGTELQILAQGEDASRAIDDLVLLVNNRFGENE